MSLLAIVAYPEFTEADRSWIEAVRAAHDPQAGKIAAHFTLVFPAEVDRKTLVAAAGLVAHEYAPFSVMLNLSEAVQGAGRESAHVFLYPDKGKEQLVAIHDRLHQWELGRLLDPTKPFAPHITVAADRLEACDRLARALERERLPISAWIRTIEVIEVFSESVSTVAAFRLEHS
jgi:2'-5' RNA ligase